MEHEHLFIGGPRDGVRLTVHCYDSAIVFEVDGVRHMYQRVYLMDSGERFDVFIHDGEPVNVIEMLIKNYRKEEK